MKKSERIHKDHDLRKIKTAIDEILNDGFILDVKVFRLEEQCKEFFLKMHAMDEASKKMHNRT